MRTRVLFVAITAVAVLAAVVRAQGRQAPEATEMDRAVARLQISLDGRTVTVRSVASDDLQLCVAPGAGKFGATRCFTVGQIRRGEVVRR